MLASFPPRNLFKNISEDRGWGNTWETSIEAGAGGTYRISRLGIGKLLADKIPQRGLDVRLLIVEDEVLAPLIGEDARIVHLSNAVSQLVFGVGGF